MLTVHYYVAGREVLIDAGEPPRVRDEVGLEGQVYQVTRVVWHRPMCPPDRVHVHLEMQTPELISAWGGL